MRKAVHSSSLLLSYGKSIPGSMVRKIFPFCLLITYEKHPFSLSTLDARKLKSNLNPSHGSDYNCFLFVFPPTVYGKSLSWCRASLLPCMVQGLSCPVAWREHLPGKAVVRLKPLTRCATLLLDLGVLVGQETLSLYKLCSL